MAHDVFISYSSKDKTIADAVCAALEQQVVRCWIAPRDALPGQNWAGSIANAIPQSRVFVLVFSAGSNASPDVVREVALAVRSGIPVIPFRIEAITPTGDLKYYLDPIHWLDALTPPLKQHIQTLVERVSSLLPASQATSKEPAAPVEPPARGNRMTGRKWGIAGGLSLIVLLLLAVVFYQRPRSPSAQDLEAKSDPPGVVTESAAAGNEEPGVPWRKLPGHTASVSSLAFSPNGELLASAGGDIFSEGGEIFLWDVRTGVLKRSQMAHDRSVLGLAISPNGKTLASVGWDGAVRLWQIEKWALIRVMKIEGPIQSVAFSPDGTVVASGSTGGTIHLWDTDTGALQATLTGHQYTVWSVAFSPDGKMLASVGGDSKVRVWKLPGGELLQTLSGYRGPVYHASFSPDGQLLATHSSIDEGSGATNGSQVRLWDARDWELKKTIDLVHSGMAVLFSPSGKNLVASDDDVIRFWNRSGAQLKVLKEGSGRNISSLAFSPDGRVLASGSRDRNIRLWKLSDSQ